jgi:aspartate-semialdehyde dehydrogenase
MKLRAAIVGATGAVGRTLLALAETRAFPADDWRLLATERSAGEEIEFRGHRHTVLPLSPEALEAVDVAFFAISSDAARRWVPRAVAAGATVIDNSYAFRLDPQVPLVVPEINGHLLESEPKLIANPNCSTIQLVLVLAPLEAGIGLRRVVVSTYQSVSGTGTEALAELEQQLQADGEVPPAPQVYPHPIGFNVIAQVDEFREDGYSREERKLIDESRKILNLPELAITATAVRVPVRVGHCESVNLTLARAADPAEARALLAEADGVEVVDDPERGLYPTPLAAAGRDETLVGRIRRDPSQQAGLDLWICCDNLRKGAALNAMQIAENLPRISRLRGSVPQT